MGLFVAVVAALVVLVAAPDAVFAEPPDFSAIDDIARDVVASGEIPGAVILVGRGDDVLYHRAFGWRAIVPQPEAMTTDTVFDIASLTKPLGTAIAVMTLVDRNQVSLDAPLGRYLREFRKTVFNQVTIRRMLTHSAGFPGIPPNRAVRGGFPGAARALAREKLDYPPGTGFQYSDTGFILLGELVRRVTGEPLDRYLDRVLFHPLGLADTTFRPGHRLRPRTAPTEFPRGQVHDPRARLL
ncbi:MAG: beta-lactamase family protein, partial [Candidatus Rokubacteria bacterium]|nr:beta-lactamase family protein [Candidatus Rokubacteria bacterium]